MAQETEAELMARIEELTKKVDAFRDTNSGLQKALARFEGIDPDDVKALAAEKQRLEEEQRIKEGKFNEVLAEREKAARAAAEKQFAPKLAELNSVSARLADVLIDQAVVTEATKRGLRPTAIPDLTARARMSFKLVSGVPQAFEADGQSARKGKDGVSPMTLAEWVDALGTDAPHLFEANAGGGAVGSSSGGVGNRSVRNPFRKETWNVTEQMKLQRTDPALAGRLKANA